MGILSGAALLAGLGWAAAAVVVICALRARQRWMARSYSDGWADAEEHYGRLYEGIADEPRKQDRRPGTRPATVRTTRYVSPAVDSGDQAWR